MMSSDMIHLTVAIWIFIALPTVLYLLLQYSKCWGDTADTEIIFIYLRHLGRFIHLVDINACTRYPMHIQVYIKFAASVRKLAVGTFDEAALEPSCSLFLIKITSLFLFPLLQLLQWESVSRWSKERRNCKRLQCSYTKARWGADHGVLSKGNCN